MAVGLKGGVALGSLEDKTYYERKMLRRAQATLVWDKYATKSFIPTRGGTSVEWRQMPRLATTTTALAEGTFGTETPPTIARVIATVNQYGIFFRSTDIADLQAIDDLRSEGAEALGQAAGESFDLLTRAVVVAGTTTQFAGTASSRGALISGMRLTSAELREAKTTLQKNAAPKFPGGTYTAIIEPDQEYDLWGDANIVNAAQYAANRGDGNPLFTGKLANYLGIEITTSNIFYTAKTGASLGLSGSDVYTAVVFGQDYYGVVQLSAQRMQEIYHPIGSGGATGDPLNQTWSQGVKFTHAAAILDQTFGVVIQTTSSLGALG